MRTNEPEDFDFDDFDGVDYEAVEEGLRRAADFREACQQEAPF